jgi:hypothetical protein
MYFATTPTTKEVMCNWPCDTTYNAMDFNSILHHIIPLKIHCENKISK